MDDRLNVFGAGLRELIARQHAADHEPGHITRIHFCFFRFVQLRNPLIRDPIYPINKVEPTIFIVVGADIFPDDFKFRCHFNNPPVAPEVIRVLPLGRRWAELT